MSELHIGFIGGGNITQTHARAAASIPELRIAAFLGSNPDKNAKLAAQSGATAYSDLDKFLAHRPMDMVAIGSPSGLHAEHGIACAQRGLHVLTEKPIDITLERADSLIHAADRAGVQLGVFFQDRFKPEVRRLKQLVESDKLGRLILVDGRVKWYRAPEYYAGSRWRGKLALDGGGALVNQGIHTIDLLLWIANDVKSVQARMATSLHKIESEDTLVATLEFSSGAIGTFEATTSAFPGYPRRIEISGENGTAVLEEDSLALLQLKTGESEERSAARGIASSSPVVGDVSAHKAVLEDFILAIRTNGRPMVDGAEGRRSLAVVEAIYRAARKGHAVEVSR